MIERIKKTIERFQTKDLQKRGNKMLIRFLIVFFFGYFIFFTSKLWMPPSYSGIVPLKIGETQTVEDRSYTIASWVYDPYIKVMEVIVEIKDLSLDSGKNKHSWDIRSKDSTYKSQVIIEKPDFLVVIAEGVPKNFTEVALRYNREDKDPLNLYGSDKTIKIGKVKHLTELEYKDKGRDGKVAALKDEMKVLTEENRKLQKEIKIINEKMAQFKNQEEKMTKEEIEKNQMDIQKLESEMDDREKNIDENKEKIKSVKEKITLLEKK